MGRRELSGDFWRWVDRLEGRWRQPSRSDFLGAVRIKGNELRERPGGILIVLFIYKSKGKARKGGKVEKEKDGKKPAERKVDKKITWKLAKRLASCMRSNTR